MKREFEEHPVTQEIGEGITARNDSGTLEAPFGHPPERKDGRAVTDYSEPNLFSFIGFEAGSDPLAPIRSALEPGAPGGPTMKYVSMDRDRLAFRFLVSAPDKEKLAAVTPIPWLPGISWVIRIEQGIAGIGYFLNAVNRKGSRSGGGIQIHNQLRSGRFRAVSYLSGIFRSFLSRVAGRSV